MTHNYVFVESVALLQARLGVDAAVKLARDSTTFIIDWMDEEMHASGIRALHRSKKRQVSFVDHISFLVMRRRQVATAFAFDPHFTAEGFRLFPGA